MSCCVALCVIVRISGVAMTRATGTRSLVMLMVSATGETDPALAMSRRPPVGVQPAPMVAFEVWLPGTTTRRGSLVVQVTVSLGITAPEASNTCALTRRA